MADETTTSTAPETDKEPWAPWLARIKASRQRRDDRLPEWQENVDRRAGLGARTTEHAETTRVSAPAGVAINQDWPLTKAKIAQLYSQTPEIRLQPRWPEFAQAVPKFSAELNDTLTDIGIGDTIGEVLADVVNASGIGGVIVTCEKREIPKLLPEGPTMGLADIQYIGDRISPADLLVPSDFTGSNYDKARWLGREGRMTWPQSVAELGLTEDQKEKVLGQDRRRSNTTSTLNTDTTKFRDTDVVTYQELFYWNHFYNAAETNFKALRRLVFVDGLETPVVDEPYRAQKVVAGGRMVGVLKNPIRILTLTYISDESLPPSDSTIGRGQVDELEQSRADTMLQRRHSVPIRWGDSTRVSPNARARIDKGDYQSFVWTNGPGDRAIGEVARASYPPERFEFDKVIKNDLTEIWQVGTNQAGAFSSGERSAREAGIIQENFQRRVGQEQDKVTKFLLGIAEVLAGHLALYGTTAQPDEIGPDRALLANAFTYSIRVDSTVRLDADQQIARIEKVIDRGAQSPYINAKSLIRQWLELNGIDPGTEGDPDAVLITPQPKPPEPVKVSVSKAEDLMNPLFLALLNRTGQGPMPDDLMAAIKILKEVEAAMALGLVAPPPPPTDAPPPDGRPPREGDTPGIANPDWQMAPRQDKRDEDGGMD